MRDHLRALAKQAWLRVTQTGMDPVESIHRALVFAVNGKDALPPWFGSVTKAQREVVLLLASGPLSCGDVAKQLSITGTAACLRLRALKRRGFVRHARFRYWKLVAQPRTRKTK